MIAKNITRVQIEKALRIINVKYNGNIRFERLESVNQKGDRFLFTLRVKDSHRAGHALGYSHNSWTTKTGKQYKQRCLASACWHVHGDLFDAMILLAPECEIRSLDKKINAAGGNWQDWNAGSVMEPVQASERCECE